jgi:hypothetical protein
MAIGFPVKENYVTGEVLTAANMNDLSGTVNLLSGTRLASGKNAFINGNFGVWQRGTSVSVAASATATYTSDRFALTTQANQASTVSRQSTNDTTNLPTIQYCARVQRNSGQTGTGSMIFGQSLETSNSIRYVGQSVTLSFYARKGADYSATSSALSANIYTGTGTDQSRVAASYTGDAQALTTSVTLTTTWQRFTVSGTIGATATELAVIFISSMTGTASTNDYYEVTGVQLELGTTASTFQTATGTIQGELAACQRYYIRYTSSVTNGPVTPVLGAAVNTTLADFYLAVPVQMRVQATAIDYSNLAAYTVSSAASYSSGTFVTAASVGYDPKLAQVRYTHGTAVFTQGAVQTLNGSSSTNYIGFSAEL